MQITGDAIVPSSSYDIMQWSSEGLPSDDPPLYSESGVRTARWGDNGAPFQDVSASMRTQPNITDIVRAVDKVKDVFGALSRPRVHLRRDAPNPNAAVNSTDIVLTVDAVKGFGFPFNGPSPCSP